MARSLRIKNTVIDDGEPCYVIAEIGHNHQGELEQAFELFKAAKQAGASAAKLQKRHNQSLFMRSLYNKLYENSNSFGRTYGEHRERLEFGRKEYEALIQYAKEIDIDFFATAFDIPSADFLAELDMPAYKIASGDIRNTPLLRHVAKIGKPMIVSTGAASMDDVRRAFETVTQYNTQLALLQCTAGYPAKFEELDLNVIKTYRDAFPNTVVGLSAHDNGIAMAVAAYVLGARVVEKHFTLNRANKGTDHAFSLEPLGMQKMVRDLKRVRVALGGGQKHIYESEEPALVKMGKQLVAACRLEEGATIQPHHIAIRSPGGEGLQPFDLDRILGKKLLRPLAEDTPIRAEHVQL
ncbi:MAG: N-acetylneuraminate synthase family protein [Planctomycetota bacterium]